MEERKNSAARIKSNNKWTNAHYDRINIAVPKGQKDVIQFHAAARGESVNGFIGRAIAETMERDGGGTGGPAESPQKAAGRADGGGGILTPATLETAAEAAKKTGETVPAFLERAAATQASRDTLSLNIGVNPAQPSNAE